MTRAEALRQLRVLDTAREKLLEAFEMYEQGAELEIHAGLSWGGPGLGPHELSIVIRERHGL